MPATSANLGPGFDTLALALDLFLDIKAREADAFSIRATGRDPVLCGALQNNLLLEVYRDTLAGNRRDAKSLAIEVRLQPRDKTLTDAEIDEGCALVEEVVISQ